ncbi:tRNA pseudouridine(38-40) synthase TruA [Rhodobacteraceae bacterium RKSG542]|uniref:tRNA pseudouridine(38-40) synthase TruA n=1 Tax=Pseudovibrio flavus TaxID=2529854 RepID=UPI0012BBB6E0|nr:tRNA pseudouridine(38-40) synthase TruA [Pseudovibrio flavus]MTI17190.1 tRNA pseudouridine(38-40) synthase TruA [Pseudovibrio flavus]
MPRYKVTVEYDGRNFFGWQRQDNGPTVQGSVERAVKAFSGETVTIGAAGRTDSGVHGIGQVCHIDLSKEWPEDTILNALNFHLQPDAVAILKVEKAGEGFDARFSAIRRHYRYRIENRPMPLTHYRGLAWHVKPELDAEAMNDAAQVLLGHHDFTTFRHTRCQAKSPWKTMERVVVYRREQSVFMECSSRSFLHNQVRSMIGSLKLVGEGRWTKDDLRNALEAKDRKACGPVAVPDGLYLTQVDYRSPEEDLRSLREYQESQKAQADSAGDNARDLEEDADA